MMDETVRRLLLEAEPAALRGEGESEIASRVRTDPETRAAARIILDAMVDLDLGLSVLADGSVSSRTAENRAPVAAGAERAARYTARRSFAVRKPTAPPRRGAFLAWGGLATAAVVAALLLFTPDRTTPPAAEPTRPLTAQLDVESSRRFAVFDTGNPNIAIVWLFEEDK